MGWTNRCRFSTELAEGMVTGDLGSRSGITEDVGKLLRQRFPPTLVLGSSGDSEHPVRALFGLVAAIRRGTWIDSVVTFLSYVGLCIPVFMLAILLVYVFGLKLRWLPITGYDRTVEELRDERPSTAIMPVICLAMVPLAVTARQMRSSVLEVNNMDYVRTAWSKGLQGEGGRDQARPQEQSYSGGHDARHQCGPHLRGVRDHRDHVRRPGSGTTACEQHLRT